LESELTSGMRKGRGMGEGVVKRGTTGAPHCEDSDVRDKKRTN